MTIDEYFYLKKGILSMTLLTPPDKRGKTIDSSLFLFV